jgi:predicted enzyme related to lactoylglutathione lyase
VHRLAELGATVINDASDLPWVVLADPAGNRFCVLSPTR